MPILSLGNCVALAILATDPVAGREAAIQIRAVTVVERMQQAMPPILDEIRLQGKFAQINSAPKPLEWANITGPFRYSRIGVHRSLEWNQGDAKAVKIDDGEIRIDALIPQGPEGIGEDWASSTVFISKSSRQPLGQQEWLLRLPQWIHGQPLSDLWTGNAPAECSIEGPAVFPGETFLGDGETLFRVKCSGAHLAGTTLLIDGETYRLRGWESKEARVLMSRSGSSGIVRWTTRPMMCHAIITGGSGSLGSRAEAPDRAGPVSAKDFVKRARAAGANITDERQ